MPVVSLTGLYKLTYHIYTQTGINWYIPTSRMYYSTVGRANTTLTKGLVQANLGIGYQF